MQRKLDYFLLKDVQHVRLPFYIIIKKTDIGCSFHRVHIIAITYSRLKEVYFINNIVSTMLQFLRADITIECFATFVYFFTLFVLWLSYVW